MTTRVPIRYGGTGANTAASARTALGAAPLAAYDQANSAYAQANAAYNAANNAKVTVYSNNSSNVTTQNVNFVNTATVTVSVTADGSNANIAFTAAPQTVVNDTYTAAGNTAAAATANIANGLYAISTSAFAQANAAYSAANNSNLLSGGLISGTLNVTQDIIVGGNLYLSGNTTFINVSTYQVNDPLIFLAANNTLTDSVDIGFIGGKNTSGTFSHTGLARDATDAKYKLFDNLPDNAHQNNVINFANATIATLVANLEANSILLSGNAVATNVQVNAAYAQANAAYAQANLAYNAANNAQVTIYANNASNVTTQNINFVNTSSIAVTVTSDGSNANVAFSSLGGGIVNTVIKTVTFTSANAAGNLNYTLPFSPAGVPYIFVIKNGITLTPNTDYSLAGSTLTVIESGSANDTIEVRYFDSVNVFTPPDTTILVDSNVVSSQTNTFYISQNAASINSLTVSKNGLVLTPGLHFSVTNNVVTLNTAAEINDTMLFVHMYTFGNVYNDVILKTGGTMTGNLNVAASLITQNVVPNLNVTYDLGTSTKRFKDLWLSNSTIYLGNTTISANGDKLVVPALELASGANLSNAVLKTGDTMTGQLNIANGGLLVTGTANITGNSFFNTRIIINGSTAEPAEVLKAYGAANVTGRIYAEDLELNLSPGSDGFGAVARLKSPTREFKITPYYNSEGTDNGTWLEAKNVSGGAYSKITISSSDLILGATGNVGIGNTSPASKLTVAGTVESTSGGIKFPDGTTQTTAAASVTGIPSLNIISGTTVTAIAGQHYVLTNAAQTTITLAASPAAGDIVYISARNSLANNLIVPNGRNIESNSSNVIIDTPPYSLQLRYINSTLGWILI